MAIVAIERGRSGSNILPPNATNVNGNIQARTNVRSTQKTEELIGISQKAREVEVDFQKFRQNLRDKFKEIENIPSFPRNLLVKLDVGLEFGIFVLPEQIFSKLVDDNNNQTLKISPPEFLLQHRVLMNRLIAEPAFERVISGIFVNLSA